MEAPNGKDLLFVFAELEDEHTDTVGIKKLVVQHHLVIEVEYSSCKTAYHVNTIANNYIDFSVSYGAQ